jgi:amino acid adenylation domain-containing protein
MTGIPRRPGGLTPLSFAQQRLWFLDQLQPNTSTYNLSKALRLKGSLDVSALEYAFNELRRRHEVLRTNFDSIDGQPFSIVTPFHPIPLALAHFAHLPSDRREDACIEAVRRSCQRPFNLGSDQLMRVALFRLAEDEHILSVEMHHIVSDGWSVGVMYQEIAALYAGFLQGNPPTLPELPIQYADYARWQRQCLEGELLNQRLAYWKTRLDGAPSMLELPADHPRSNVRNFSSKRIRDVLPVEMVDRLNALSRRHQASLFMTLLAACQILLSRLSGQEDIVVGSPVAGRRQLETEKLIGFFVNTLPLRGDVSGNPTFEELLVRVRSVVLEAMEHDDIPFERLVEAIQPDRSLTHTPLFQIMLNVFLRETELQLYGLELEELQLEWDHSKFDVTIYVRKKKKHLQVVLAYNAALFEAPRMEELLRQFRCLLEQIVVSPEKRIASYSLTTTKSRTLLPDPASILVEPRFEPVADEFLLRANEAPTRTAVAQSGRSWTYEDLARSAKGIAGALLQYDAPTRRRDKPVVAVMGATSFGLVAAVTGIAMSRSVLLTIDRSLSPDRQRVLLTESRARYLLYIGPWRPQDAWLRQIPDLKIITVADDGTVPSSVADASLPQAGADDPAYIFFTSGTTGTPRGILGCQKGLSHFLRWQKSAFGIGPGDRCAHLTSLSFDVVLRDIFLPLVSGAILCLPDSGMDAAPDRTLAWMSRERVTTFHAAPSVGRAWINQAPEVIKLPSLRWAFFAGEPLTGELVWQWSAVLPETARIVNLYGPSETTLAKCCQVTDDPSPGVQAIGRPLPQTQALVLNRAGRLCGVGELGEIVIRTPFRTLGYINAPEEQAKRFVKNPFRNDSADVLYRTGDLGRFRPDGALEFLGRIDDQVKIRGVRIEPAEISAVLERHDGVKACFVSANEGPGRERVLIAYVVPSPTNAPAAEELRVYLSKYLPAVMWPQAFIFLNALPLTTNGKVDRRKLPAPDFLGSGLPSRFDPPRTPAEHALATIWSRVLKVQQIGIHDNFFDLGGHSLIAMQLVAQIRQEFRVEVPVRAIFANPTIETLGLHLLERRTAAYDFDEIEALLTDVESLPDESPELQNHASRMGGTDKRVKHE